MDYNWLENVPSSLTPMPVYQPDFSFLQSMQMKANQEYEQGFSQVKSVYGSIFNKPVTGDAMAKRQQEYARQAQDQMKAISASDLSDPKNVMAAENILRPFYKDPLLVKNIAYTGWYTDQFDKQQAMKNSTDKETRALYNPLVDTYLSNGLDQLAKAPLTTDAYNKIEKRESIPVEDIDAVARKEWTEMFGKDGGIKTTTADGAVMTIQTNGPKSLDGYKAFYLSVAKRDKYVAQNRVLATARMENDMKDIQDRYPNMTPEQIRQEYGNEVVQGTIKYYNEAIGSYAKTANEWRAKNNSLIETDKDGRPLYPDKAVPPDVAAQITYNNQMAKQFQDLADNTKLDFTKRLGYNDQTGVVDIQSNAYKQAVNDIASNPRDYISDVYMNHAADRWATGIASIHSVDIKENPAWAALNKQDNENWDRQYKLLALQTNSDYKEDNLALKTLETYRKLGIPITQAMLDEAGVDVNGIPTGAGPATGFTTGSGSFGANGKKPIVPNIGSGRVENEGTDVGKIPNLLNSFREHQQSVINGINTTAFSNQGFLNILTMLPNGMEAPDVALLSNDLQRAISTGKYDMSPEAIKRREQFVKILADQTGDQGFNNPNIGPGQLRDGLMALVHKQAELVYQSADADKLSQGMTWALQYQDMQNSLANYAKLQDQYNKLMKSTVDNDTKGYYKKAININTHQPYTPAEMASDFVPLTVTDRKGNSTVLSQEQVAQLWKSGDLVYNKEFDSPGVSHYELSLKSSPYSQVTGMMNFNTNRAMDLHYLTSKYGKPGEQEEIMRRLGVATVGQMGDYKNGISASSINYDYADKDNPTQQATAREVLQEVLVPTNEGTYPMYEVGNDNKMTKQVSADLQSVMHDAKFRDLSDDLISGIKITQLGPNGVPAAEITFKAGKEGKSESSDVAELRNLKHIWIDISPDAKGPILNQLPKLETLYKYGNLLTSNDPILASDTEKNMGFDYSIVPGMKGQDGRSATATMISRRWQIDDKGMVVKDDKGVPLWTPWNTSQPFNLLNGDKAVSPDELYAKKDNWIMSVLRSRQQLLKIHNSSNNAEAQGHTNWPTIGSLYK